MDPRRADCEARLPLPSASPPCLPRVCRYRSGIEGVTPQAVLLAAQRHLHPDRLTAVVVGDASVLRPQLAALGREIVDLELD